MEKARVIFWIAHMIFWSGLVIFRMFEDRRVNAISWSVVCFGFGIMVTTLFF